MYVFIIFGSVSIALGIVALVLLPDVPSTARFLADPEKVIAAKRVSANRQGIKNRHFKSYQMWQTFTDPKTWILFVMAVGAQVPNSALTQFTSLVIKSFNVDTLGTQYLQIPGGAVQFVALLGGGFICSKYPNTRCIAMIVANTICIIGSGLLVGLPNSNKWGRLVGLWLCYFQGLGFSMSLTMVSSNIAGYTKKQLTAAILFTGYCVGNIIGEQRCSNEEKEVKLMIAGPQTFKDSEAPRYHSAYVAMVRHVFLHPKPRGYVGSSHQWSSTVQIRILSQEFPELMTITWSQMIGYIIKLLAIVVLYIYMYLVNKKRDREAAAAGTMESEIEKDAIESGMHDITELDNKGFRYTL